MKKPNVKLIGEDSNIFFLLGRCTKELKKIGQTKEAKELAEKVFESSSYAEALNLCSEYVEIE